MDTWITTHWPSPEGFEVDRNVYIKSGRASLPSVGDLILVYEAEGARVNGKAVRRAEMRHHGRREWVELPKGRARIVSAVTVQGGPRRITEEDRVYEYGNLSEWSLIPCGGEKQVREVSRRRVMELLGKAPDTSPRFWSLWRVPGEHVDALLAELGI